MERGDWTTDYVSGYDNDDSDNYLDDDDDSDSDNDSDDSIFLLFYYCLHK